MSFNWLAIRVWLLTLILTASMAGSPAFAQAGSMARVDPSTASVSVNDTVNIAVKVDNITNLAAFEIHLSFDPNVLEVTSLTNGGFVAADLTVQNTFNNTAGTIDYAVAQINRSPAQGSGTLLNIVFRAKAVGSSTLTTHAMPAAPSGLIFSDQNGTEIPASWTPGTINIGPSTSITNTPTATQTPTPTATTNTPTTNPVTGTPTSTPTSTPTTNPVTGTPTSTPTNTPAITPTSSSSSSLGTHVVRWGEWLYCIGRAYKVSPWAIAGANGLWWPYLIFPNQRLIIPNVPWTNIPAGPVCKAQFTASVPNPTATATPTSAAIPTPTATSTASPTPTSTIAPSTCRAIYVVRPGDTLYRIALRFGTSYTEIAQVNRISDPRLIYPGQQLCIP
jgi:LysM repeat protein